MKSNCILALVLLSTLLAQQTIQDDLQYNFEIKNGKNTLVVSKEDQQKKDINPLSKSSSKHQKKLHQSKVKKSKKDELSKMVKLGVLIDRITDRLKKDNTNKSNKSLIKKEKKNDKKERKAFSMGAGLGVAAGGAAVVGAGMMAGAAENDAIQVLIDKAKMEQTVLYIKDRMEQESNDLLNKSNRGFGVLKVKAQTLISNFNLTFNIAYDHIGNMLDDMENDYENVGVKPKD